MLSYWLVLLAMSLRLLGGSGILRVLARPVALNLWLWGLLALPVVLAFAFGPLANKLPLLTPTLLLLSAILAIVNASLEELFWRGVYADAFSSLWMAWLYPAIGFAWHFAPLSILPYKKGAVFFVLSAFLLGLCWGMVAFKTKSILWDIASHFLVDLSGFGALLYLGDK